MDLGLKGKTALVAASSRGLGKAVAIALAREGAKVAITARGEERLYATAEEIRQLTGSTVLAVPADVSSAAEIEALMDRVLAEFGHVDILVNNAGGPRPGQFADMTDDDWLRAVQLNLMSTIRLTRRALPEMRARRWGRIINITSTSVKQPLPNLILSNTVRAGVVAMAKTLSSEIAAEGITVNNVCPGYTLTDRIQQLAESNAETEHTTPDAIMDRWRGSIPAGRLGKPEELAALVAFLASEQAAYITGTTTQVDGGAVKSLL
ncbi:MAG: SDR family oxidoreductase [Chloroflexi bacterium]|jgi:3-oxoacyl-[acyl-carrier protein] reductase|nr:SDR family oxidoreductase [Chloroflexota bacterium]